MDRTADFSKGDIIKIHSCKIEEMKHIVDANEEKKRYRICLHDAPDNEQHEMIICTKKGDYTRPHKHIGQSETHTILDGSEWIVLFYEDGTICDSFILDREKGYITYRINSEIFHMSIPITDYVVKLETKKGPFNKESNIFAEWAPNGTDIEAADEYVHIIEGRLKENEYKTV